MALKNFKLAIGDGFQEVLLPEEKVVQVIESGTTPPIKDIKSAVTDALRNPIASKPLSQTVKKGDKVSIIVSDITRSWIRPAEFLPFIIDEIKLAGIEDEDISIVIALGGHRPHTKEEDIIMCGKDIVERFKIYQHDCLAKDLVLIGTTSRKTPVWINKRIAQADKVILTGAITMHFIAGFGGGRKAVLPGVSGYETIQKNHSLSMSEIVGGGINEETRVTRINSNPLNDDMIEACAFLNPCFLVNAIIDSSGNFSRFVAGHWYKAWLEGTDTVMKMQRVDAKEKVDIVFASAGGFPKDVNIYQASKVYDIAGMSIKPDGIVIAALEAREASEPRDFMDNFHFADLVEMEKAVRAKYTIPFFAAFRLALLCKSNKVFMVTKKENFDIARKTGQIPFETIEEAWAQAQKEMESRGVKNYTINILPHAANTLPVFQKSF
ncbi:MAG: nickel-dependent lactate racemase [Elusimicrobiota bacterium]|jgi:nickel-dependent lactate racemase|nr:nickel-dependent lactate racemase [Elusimicrobiota bacterium]